MRHLIFGTVIAGLLVFWAVQATPAALFQPQSPTPAPTLRPTPDVQATVQRAVDQTQVAAAATQVASVPAPAQAAAPRQVALTTATPVPQARPAPVPTIDRPTLVGQQLIVGSMGYLVPDGKGKEIAGDAVAAVLSKDPLTLAKTAVEGSVYHLNGGTHVQVLDEPGPHGTHVRVLDGPHAGTQGTMLNRSLGI